MRLQKLVIPAALILALLMSAVTASAASVGTLGGSLFSAGAPVTFTPAARSVTGITRTTTGSPATMTSVTATVSGTTLSELNGQAVNLILLNSSNAQVQAITATLATGTNLTVGGGGTTATITLNVSGSPVASTVTGWAIFIAGVQVLNPSSPSTTRVIVTNTGTFAAVVTTWQDALVTEGNANVNIVNVAITTATTVSQCITVTITGTSATPTTWSLDLDFGAPPYYGIQPSDIQKAQIQSTNGTVNHLIGLGTGNGQWLEWTNNAKLTNAQTLDILICQYSAGVAPNRPEAYTASAASVSGTWSSNQACKKVTVTGNGTYPFYFGWQVSIPMADAYAYLRTFDAGAPRSFSYTPDTVSPAFSGAVTTYTVSNYRDDEIKNTDSFAVVLCANRN
jgi:hypothetical protein